MNVVNHYLKATSHQLMRIGQQGFVAVPKILKVVGLDSSAHVCCLGVMLKHCKIFLGPMHVFVMACVLKVGLHLLLQQLSSMVLILRHHSSFVRDSYLLGGCVASTPVYFDNHCKSNIISRIHHVTPAWCTAACTGVPYARSTGKWRTIYLIMRLYPWPLLTLRQFKRWTPVRTRSLRHLHNLQMENTEIWKFSRCRIFILKLKRISFCGSEIDTHAEPSIKFFSVLKKLLYITDTGLLG